MTLPRITSPHATGTNRTQRVMLLVMAATVPGILALSFFFGIGPLLNIVLACGFALLFEAAILALRQRPIGFFLKDGSVLVTGVTTLLTVVVNRGRYRFCRGIWQAIIWRLRSKSI